MLLTALIIAGAALAGAASGALAAWFLIRRRQRHQPQAQSIPLTDPAVSAEIQRAAGAWAEAQRRPEAIGLMADKLRLLHRISRKRGWWSR